MNTSSSSFSLFHLCSTLHSTSRMNQMPQKLTQAFDFHPNLCLLLPEAQKQLQVRFCRNNSEARICINSGKLRYLELYIRLTGCMRLK